MANKQIDAIAKIKEILQDKVEKIKPQVSQIIENAASEFYQEGNPGSYSRTNSFLNFKDIQPTEDWTDKSVTLIYTLSSDKVTVNPWTAPWGKDYEGDPERAFITGVNEGFHGGPKPSRNGGWTWDNTQQTTPIADLIFQHLDEITI